MAQYSATRKGDWKLLKAELGSQEVATSAFWQKLEARNEMNQLNESLYDYDDLLAELDAAKDQSSANQRWFIGR